MDAADKAFQDEKAASERCDWYNPIPPERKVDTAKSFLRVFYDEEDLEIAVCSVCYMQKKPRDLDRVDWRRAIPESIPARLSELFACRRYFPLDGEEAAVPVCSQC